MDVFIPVPMNYGCGIYIVSFPVPMNNRVVHLLPNSLYCEQ